MLGPAAKLITEIMVCVYCFGCCVTLLVVMGDQIEDGKRETERETDTEREREKEGR